MRKIRTPKLVGILALAGVMSFGGVAFGQTLVECAEAAATKIGFVKSRGIKGKVLKPAPSNRVKLLFTQRGKQATLFGSNDKSGTKLTVVRLTKYRRSYVEFTGGGTVVTWTYYLLGKSAFLVAQKSYGVPGKLLPVAYTYAYMCRRPQ